MNRRPYPISLSNAFAEIPRAVRRHSIEVELVRRKMKRALLLTVCEHDAEEALAFVASKGLFCACKQLADSPKLFAHLGIRDRQLLTRTSHFRITAAPLQQDANQILKLAESDYSECGKFLGYPPCCVNSAARNDALTLDQQSGMLRQQNLITCAIKKSLSLNFRTNNLFFDSPISQFGPTALISHYPCSYDCDFSGKLASEAFGVLAEVSPEWTIMLSDILRGISVYFDDHSWTSEFWAESCGISLLRGFVSDGYTVESPFHALPLGSQTTPFGRIPDNIVGVRFIDELISLKAADGGIRQLNIPATNSVWILDWQNGRILQRAIQSPSEV